jgi:penicillin-binding protein 1A
MSDDPSKSPPAPASPARRWAIPLLRALLYSFGLLGALVLCAALIIGMALAAAYPRLPDLRSILDYQPKLPMRVYSAEGVLLGEFGEERRNYLSIKDIPKVVQDAVLAIEDARFYQHQGVDYRGVLRAGLENLREARSQGASTITMQVARNFYLSTEKTFTRKIYEILLSLKIESLLSKDQILELYMNQIYLGQRAYGFAAASEVYFGKPLKDVNIAEAAMLAGLPKAPSSYNPIANPRRALIRQRYIVERMLETGVITPAQRDQALATPLRYHPPVEVQVHAEYVAETARQLIFAQYGEAAYTRGLNVYTAIRAADQAAAYKALRKGLMDYERRQVYRGPEDYVDLPADAKGLDARVAEALDDRPDNGELLAAVVLEASQRKVVVAIQNGDVLTVTGEGLMPVASGLRANATPKVQIRRGSVVRVIKGTVGSGATKSEWSLTQVPEVEGAFVSLDPNTGEIRSLVGGFDYAKNKFNHVTQAWRQPGSSFKPFIYSAALERGITPATVVNDAPLFFGADTTGSQPWEPKNYDGTFDGPMPLRKALAKSKNMVSIRVLQATGNKFAQDWITRFGFEAERHPAYLTMALGAGTVTPLQMASAYSVFANGGHRINPVLITRITGVRDRPVVQAQIKLPDEDSRTIDARNAYLMTSLLQEVTRSGTAAKAQATLKRPDLYGKTGTTNDSMDAWFAGYAPGLTAVVWIGYDQPRKLGDRETGGGLSLPVWIDYMSMALKGVPVAEPAPPDGLVHQNGEWFYEETTRGGGIQSLGLDDKPAENPNEDEKKSILDLFKR